MCARPPAHNSLANPLFSNVLLTFRRYHGGMSLHKDIARAIQNADTSYFFEDYTKQARAVLRALEQGGYRIVPKEPTDAMLQAGSEAILPGKVRPEALVRHVFASMTEAAQGKK